VTDTDTGRLADLSALARSSEDYRREVLTTGQSQVVLMTIAPGDEIGEEVHEDHDQFLAFVSGDGEVVLDGDAHRIGTGSLTFVPGGTRHNVRNTGDGPLRIVTTYAPPEHDPGTVHRTKEEADAAEH
jgi:mannose-6-phosphate isomerase-like protein (cupin superfamily)